MGVGGLTFLKSFNVIRHQVRAEPRLLLLFIGHRLAHKNRIFDGGWVGIRGGRGRGTLTISRAQKRKLCNARSAASGYADTWKCRQREGERERERE